MLLQWSLEVGNVFFYPYTATHVCLGVYKSCRFLFFFFLVRGTERERETRLRYAPVEGTQRNRFDREL